MILYLYRFADLLAMYTVHTNSIGSNVCFVECRTAGLLVSAFAGADRVLS